MIIPSIIIGALTYYLTRWIASSTKRRFGTGALILLSLLVAIAVFIVATILIVSNYPGITGPAASRMVSPITAFTTFSFYYGWVAGQKMTGPSATNMSVSKDQNPVLENKIVSQTVDRNPEISLLNRMIDETSEFLKQNGLDSPALIAKAKKNIIQNSEDLSQSVRNGRRSPKSLVYRLLVFLIEDELSSGVHHIYRGVLGTYGNQLIRTLDLLLDQLGKLDHDMTPDIVSEQKQVVRENIKWVG